MDNHMFHKKERLFTITLFIISPITHTPVQPTAGKEAPASLSAMKQLAELVSELRNYAQFTRKIADDIETLAGTIETAPLVILSVSDI